MKGKKEDSNILKLLCSVSPKEKVLDSSNPGMSLKFKRSHRQELVTRTRCPKLEARLGFRVSRAFVEERGILAWCRSIHDLGAMLRSCEHFIDTTLGVLCHLAQPSWHARWSCWKSFAKGTSR